MTYRFYLTKSLQLIPQNKYLQKELSEIYEGKIDTRSAEEIAEDIIAGAELKIDERW